MTTNSIKIPERVFCFFLLSINFIIALAIGFFDEGANSFRFLLDAGSVATVVFISIALTMLPIGLYFLLETFNLNKGNRVIISSVTQLLIVFSMTILYL